MWCTLMVVLDLKVGSNTLTHLLVEAWWRSMPRFFFLSTNASREELSLLAFDWPIVTPLTLLLASIHTPVGSK